jgi:hypothetical protein
MRRLSISKAWDDTKAIMSRDGRLIGATALALVVLPQTIFGAFVTPSMQRASPVVQLGAFVMILIGVVAQVALNRLSIAPSTTVGQAIIRGVQRLPALLTSFIAAIIAMTLLFIPVAVLLVAAGLVAEPTTAGATPRGLLGFVVIYFLFFFAILQLMIPVAAAEDGGPLRLLKRSWILGKSDYLRLLAFVVIVMVGLAVVWLAGQFISGILANLLLGTPQSGNLSAALISLVVAVTQGAFTALSAVMLARIYVQLAGGGAAQASVPSSGI